MKYRTIGTDPKNRREVSVLSLGTMHFGTATDEATSFAILDRYEEAGGTFIDTANSYAFWTGTQGGESEELLGRWRRSRGVGDEIVIATKLGARPLAPGTSFTDNAEGLSADVIRESSQRSRDRLGVGRLDLLFAHIEDPVVPLAETVEAFAVLGAAGPVGRRGPAGPAVRAHRGPGGAAGRDRGGLRRAGGRGHRGPAGSEQPLVVAGGTGAPPGRRGRAARLRGAAVPAQLPAAAHRPAGQRLPGRHAGHGGR